MKNITKVMCTLPLLLALFSCGKEVSPSKSRTVTSLENLGAAEGNFRLIATDAPFTYDNVSSAKVIVNRAEAISSTDKIESLLGQPIALDLVALKNGLVTVVVDLDLPPGDYKEIRLVIDSGSIDLKSGQHYNLKIPSGTSSGLKIKLDPAIKITTQASSDILLDFDLARSYVPQGDAKDESTITGFHFKPVLRASNLTTAGTLTGKISSDQGTPDSSDDVALAGAVVSVSQDNAVVSSAVTDASGNYKIIGLPQGTYSVEVSSVGYTNSLPDEVSIVAGNVTTNEEILLAKTPESVTP